MTVHAFAEYIRYRWRAKGRHGTHSPFAYRFVEQALRSTDASLHDKLAAFFAAEDVSWIPAEQVREWKSAARAVQQPDQVLIFENIHETRGHTNTWNELSVMPHVKMSIDLYKYGVLLFRKEFTEQQHFVLK